MPKRRRSKAKRVDDGTEATPPVYNTVFIDTSLDTHLALIVTASDTFALLKQKLMVEHLQCFPEFGEISIRALKVKRKGYFYHLPDSMLVESAFEGNKKSWFLSVDASSLKQCGESHQSRGPNASSQLPLLCLPPILSGAGHNVLLDHTSTSAVHESSLLEAVKCTNEKVGLTLSDPRGENSKDIGTEVKRISGDLFRNVTFDSNRMRSIDVEEKGIVRTPVEHDRNNGMTGVSSVQNKNLVEPYQETAPVAIKERRTKKRKKDVVGDPSSKENIASNNTSVAVASRPEIVGTASSLVNAGEKLSNSIKMGDNDDSEEATSSGPAAKKRRKTESQEVCRIQTKEKEVLVSSFDKYTSIPEINIHEKSTEDEHYSQNNTPNSLLTEPPDNDRFRTDSTIGKKSKKHSKRKKDDRSNLLSALDHTGTVLPSIQYAGGKGSLKENGEINSKDFVKPHEVQFAIGDSVTPEALSQTSRINQKKNRGDLVQEVVKDNLIPSSSKGVDVCDYDICNVDGKGSLSDVAVGPVVKVSKSLKHDPGNRKVKNSLPVAVADSTNNNIRDSAKENGIGDDQKSLNVEINIEDERNEREISRRHDAQLLVSGKSEPYQEGTDVKIEVPVSSIDIFNNKAVTEVGNSSGKKRKKKRAKRSTVSVTDRDESEQKLTNASSKDAKEGKNHGENEAENLTENQMVKDLSPEKGGKSPDSNFFQPTRNSPSMINSKGVGAMSTEDMIEIKQSTAKGLQSSPNKSQANIGRSLELNQVEGQKVEGYIGKREKSRKSVPKNSQDIPDKVVQVAAEELPTSNDITRDADKKSKRIKKSGSVEPSAVNVELNFSTDHITKNVDSVHVQIANTFENVSTKKEAKFDTQNQIEASKGEGDEIDFKHYFMAGNRENEAVGAERTTRSERDMKTMKSPTAVGLASSRTSANRSNSLQSHENQESGVKAHVKSTGGIEPRESFSKKSSEVSGNGVKASRSPNSSQMKTPQPGQSQIVAAISANRAQTPVRRNWKNVSSAASSSSSSSGKTPRDKVNNKKKVLSSDLHHVAGKKGSTKSSNEVIHSSQREKTLFTTPGFIFTDDSSDSSACEDGSDASTRTPSDNVSSLGLEGDSDSSMDSPRNGSNAMEGREAGENTKKPRSSLLKDATMDMIFRSSNRYKKAKLTAESQPDDSESQPIDCVPDSQANP